MRGYSAETKVGKRQIYAFRRVLNLARSGRFIDHAGVTAFVEADPGYDLIAEWMADPSTRAVLDDLCAEARGRNANGT